MPRKWTNSSGSGGSTLKHRFVERTPVVTCDYRVVDIILASNAKLASREKQEGKRPRKNSD